MRPLQSGLEITECVVNNRNLFSSELKFSLYDLDYGQNGTHLPLPTRWFTAVRRKVTLLGKNHRALVGKLALKASSLHFSLLEDTCYTGPGTSCKNIRPEEAKRESMEFVILFSPALKSNCCKRTFPDKKKWYNHHPPPLPPSFPPPSAISCIPFSTSVKIRMTP